MAWKAWNILVDMRYRVTNCSFAVTQQVYIQMASIPHVMSDLCGAIQFIFKDSFLVKLKIIALEFLGVMKIEILASNDETKQLLFNNFNFYPTKFKSSNFEFSSFLGYVFSTEAALLSVNALNRMVDDLKEV